MKGRKHFIVCMFLLFFTFSFIGVQKIIAEEVEFTGTTAPLNVNVREAKSLNANIVDVIPGNTKVSFKGWEYGEAVKDYWTGNLDNRWFYYFKDGKKVYVTSAYINGNPPNTSIDRKLSVPNILQERSNWCWAGTSVSVLNYFGKTPSQDQYVRYVKGGSYNNPATSREIQYGLSGYGVSSAISSGAKSYDWFKRQINSNQPMIALIMWQNGANIGHFLVLDGFYKGTNGTDYITYMDPWYGDHYNHNFSTFHNNNNFWWSETVYNIHAN
ncbi:papain-like cysteine protease family protein [Bacillus cereus]|uniref:papain-like cysteine protease family protein n=1 Tax=Bacillus cereus TaxID=1396 RepID=UPI0007AB58A5|nr:papain-like cysteine protease family protein [Bacillus cereus]KZD35323.1 hypothetical protein B4081_2053 [Bacillus cereus]MCC2394533.1 C39 family peptidase [Bacillus cereus]MCU5662040.1 C39 family peptidase [Bacillus cereus]